MTTDNGKFRPLLSAKVIEKEHATDEQVMERLQKMRYPLWGSPKVDGIRTLVDPEEGPVTRTFKRIPNTHVYNLMKDHFNTHRLDGELVAGYDPVTAGLFNRSQSAFMSHGGQPEFSFWVFDTFFPASMSYDLRYSAAHDQVRLFQQYYGDSQMAPPFQVNMLPFMVLTTPEDVLAFEQECLEAGYEGIMLRDPKLPYKFNRSTFKEQYLVKLKRTLDAEGTIIGFEPLLRNLNPQERDAYGLAKRSSHSSGKVADDLLGKYILSTEWGELKVGSGIDVTTRLEVWNNQEKYLGKKVTFKYSPLGMKDKPRWPIFKGFRED